MSRNLLRRTALVVMGFALAAAMRPARAAAAVTPATIRSCILAAASAYREPPPVLLILLEVEGGALGAVSPNTNGTVDIGPMQVNSIWIPTVADHWRASRHAAFLALRDNFCANVEAGAWILRQGVDEAGGDLWEGVGYYHSHNPGYTRSYLRLVLREALRLEASARAAAHPKPAARQSASIAAPRAGS